MIVPSLVILPLIAALAITLIARNTPRFSEITALITTLLLALFSLLLFPILKRQSIILYEFSGWNIPYTISLVVDDFSVLLLLLISLLSFTTILFSLQYMRPYGGSWNYYSLLLFLVTGMNGVALSGDLFNVFVFTEISLFASFALISFQGRSVQFEAAFKYAIMGFVTSTFILFGIGSIYSLASTLTLMHISYISPESPAINLVYALFIAGFGFKAALFPFHFWLPDVHSSAPSPISAMLSGVLIKVLGAYALIRLFYTVFGAPRLPLELLLIMGTVSMVLGALMAIPQNDIKRMLAYSSVSQMGYILFSFGLGSPLGILGAVYHILNHSMLKGILFFNAGAIELLEGTREMDLMKGIQDHTLYATTFIGSMSISGIPPFAGFFSKVIIVTAAIQAGRLLYAFIAIAVSVVTLGYYLSMMGKVFRKNSNGKKKAVLPKSVKIAILVLTVFSLAASLLYVPVIREITLERVVDSIMDRDTYISLFLNR